MKSLIFLLPVFFLLFGCSNSDDLTNNENGNSLPDEIDYSLIGKGKLHGGGDESIQQSNMVVTNTAMWNQLMSDMNSVNLVTDEFTETNIDFNNYLVLAVFDEVYENGGHTIDITNLIENANNIIVSVEKLHTGGVSSVFTQPFHIVKIPITNKPIVFQ